MDANVSLWEAEISLPAPAPLSRDLNVDVCVVGGGITGVTTAYFLAQEGQSVALIDRGSLLRGESKHTTAHLSNAIDDRYTRVEKVRGQEVAKIAAESHSAAIDTIERIARDEGIDCDFERVDGFLFPGEGQDEEILDEELKAAHRAGLTGVEKLAQAPVDGFSVGPCLRFPRLGQFHPLKYLNGLVKICEQQGVQCFGQTPALDITGGPEACVQTGTGHTIHAQAIVVATNSPVNHRYAMHTKLFAYRSFVVVFRVPRGSVKHALYWDTLDIYHYVRLQRDSSNESDFLIVGGEDHKTGQGVEGEDPYERLEAWTRARFPSAGKVVHRWSGQVLETLDGLAYIGPAPAEADNVFIATGDSGMGMTHGTLAGLLLRDLILGRENPWATAYDPSRTPPFAASHFAEENINVGMRMMRWLTPGTVSSEAEVGPHSGGVLRDGLTKLAVYRDEKGEIHKSSAICPHLGCVVGWNPDTRTWDCPCHGSRFDPYGEVLTGPAKQGLEKKS